MLDIEKKTSPLSSLYSLQREYDVLNQLCKTLDPYKELSVKQKETLSNFNIRCWENPFQLTNEILQALMNLEEKINNE